MEHVKGMDRDQVTMISLGEMVAEDAHARVIDLFVDALPLDELGFKYTKLAREGRPPYAPGDMLKLYMYGYRHGIRSSRKLQKACQVNVEIMWLLNGLTPDDRTIARFRKANGKAIRKAFRHFVLLLKDWELVDGNTIAIDSFKIRAQNSLKNNLNQNAIDRQYKYHEEKLEKYLAELERGDTQDPLALKEKIDRHICGQANYGMLEDWLRESGEDQISLTDPDARAVVFQRNSVRVGYNVQAASDGKHKLMVHTDVLGVNDTHALHPMARQVQEILGPAKMTTLTDKGYTTGEQLAKCEEDDIITYSSPKETSSNKNGLYNLSEFEYDKAQDHYTCPAGHTMTTNGSSYQKGSYTVKHYKTKACKGCELRDNCTKAKNGRFVERSCYQQVLERNQARVEAHPEYYRNRQQITEHQFGTLKRQWGFTFTLMKGKAKVLAEVELNMMCYNLCRVVAILGPNELKRRLKVLIFAFLGLMRKYKPSWSALSGRVFPAPHPSQCAMVYLA